MTLTPRAFNGTQGAKFFLELITLTEFGCHPDELSLFGFLVYIQSTSGFAHPRRRARRGAGQPHCRGCGGTVRRASESLG